MNSDDVTTILAAINAVKDDVKGVREEVKDLRDAVTEVDKHTAVISSRMDSAEERGTEDRDKRDGQVNKLHDEIKGQTRFLTKEIKDAVDPVAEKTGENGKAISGLQSDFDVVKSVAQKVSTNGEAISSLQSDFDAHHVDANRHTGETPGGGAGRGLAIGGVSIGGAYGIVELIKAFTGA